MSFDSRPGPENTLRVLRAVHRKSQSEVAAALGISQSTYSQIENRFAVPSEVVRTKLAELFGVSEAEVFPGQAVA